MSTKTRTASKSIVRLKMPYGKHQGEYVDQLPETYLNWLLVNAADTMPSALLRAVEAAVNGESADTQEGTEDPRKIAAAYLKERFASGRWVPLFLDDLNTFTLRELAVLGIIVNMTKARADQQGYVQLSPAYLEDGPLALSPDRQEKVLASLAEKGIIAIQHRGTQRFVRVHFEALCDNK